MAKHISYPQTMANTTVSWVRPKPWPILSTPLERPVNLNEDVDVVKAKQEKPPFHYRNGSIVCMIDFGPGVESPFHRSLTIDYGIVIEEVFELTLDSGRGASCVREMSVSKGLLRIIGRTSRGMKPCQDA
ncbi:hypothetical protein FocnCong_v012213 [Fusarium oxysporum f. sp. conglutinans]|nr:hypothetical protein FocnCong_v012213 [Fusarium oxysporum f. sp. conglutinans]